MIIESDQKPSGKRNLPKPPDGGWGWFVVIASFFIHIIADGVAYTIGIFFVKISEDLHASKSATSWIPSIMAAMTYGVGPVAGALVNKFGCRTVSIAGSIIASFGFSISYFAQSVWFLYVSIGVIGGLGLGLMYLPSIVCVTCYFEKRRAFATGIAVCGSGLGTFLLAQIINWLIRNFGWRTSLLITGGIILLCFFFSLLFRPLQEGESDTGKSQETIPTIVEPDSESEEIKPLMHANGSRTTNGFPIGIGVGSPVINKQNPTNLAVNDTLTMSCSHPALRLVGESTDSLPRMGRLMTKRHSLRTLTFGSSIGIGIRPNSPGSASQTAPAGVILTRKDIFYSGSLVKLPTATDSKLNFGNGVSNTHFPLPSSQTFKEPQEEEYDENSSEFKKVIKAMLDFSLLKSPVFLFFAVSNFLTCIGYNVPYIYLPYKATGDPHQPLHEDDAVSFLVSIIGIANILSRIILGYLSDKKFVNRLYLYNTALIICGLATGLCSHTDNIHLLQLYSATFGSTVGVFVSLTSVILVDLLSLEKLTNAFGLILLFQGVGTLIGPPVVGFLIDKYDDYIYGFWLAGGMIAISGLMLFLIPLIKKKYESSPAEDDGTNNMEHIVIHCPGEKGQKGSNNNVSKY